ncbi:hypothetical protein [Bifidobacterium sp. ESL0800]|uniref:hypothetical protein n=1 Tax=Bifidobacterium sp. ESL0800 TaxID=2983236 RepID=UPI0023F80D5D|nr:hypothetical protein [Bifidobacterium sp. ESL0800]WEV76214.1 hypothetical protein OZX75_03240 [Bifidobacterium sp. ESL0800]
MKNFFKGISVSQIIAGALAAVTSFLLSAKIGIAGSVIGVAVGSIVSAVASQIYQNVLKESSRKLQENAPQDDDTGRQAALGAGSDDQTRVIGSDVQHHGQLRQLPAHGSRVTPMLRDDGTSASLAALASTRKTDAGFDQHDATKTLTATQVGKHESDETTPAAGKADRNVEGTQVLAPSAFGKTSLMPPVARQQQSRAGSGKTLKSGPGQHDGHIRVFDSSKQKRYKRLAIVVAVVSALVAVGITAGIISLATKGQGTDDVVRNIVTNSATKNRQQRNDPSNTESDSNQKTDGNSQKNNGTTDQSNSGSSPDSGTSSGSTSNGSGGGSGNANGDNSGNGNSGNSGNGADSDSNNSSDSSNTGTSNGNNSGSTDSGSTGGSTSGSTGTGGNGSGSTSGSQTGNGTTGTNSGAKK